jgi:hypoxanthine phosphoribosyltransferase
MMTLNEANRVFADADLLADETEVKSAIERLACQMTAQLADKMPVMLCVMNGALIFAGQLLTKLVFPLEVEYVHATRYGSDTEGGSLDWIVRPARDLEGRTVVLIDDILDEGVTLSSIAEYCKEAGASEVLMAVLIYKLHDRKMSPGFRADFTGIETEDRFLFGYGLDYKGFWRNAPGIYAVKGL